MKRSLPLILTPNCVAVSILSAWTAEQHQLQTRILTQKIDKVKNVDHVQAEAKVDGLWIPLTPLWNNQTGLYISSWTRHFPDEVYRFLTLDELIEEQKKFRR